MLSAIASHEMDLRQFCSRHEVRWLAGPGSAAVEEL